MKNQFRSTVLAAVLLILTSFLSVLHAQVQTPRYVSIAQNSGGYYEYLPQGYSATGTETYPLIIFFHGLGEKGAGNSSTLPLVLKNGLPKVISQGKFPTSFTVNGKTSKFIVISPQFATWPGATQVGQIIDYAKKNYKVDASRVYVTGLSMGGACVWDGAVSTNVSKIAAIVPVCGARAGSVAGGRVIATNNLPVWALHNETDPTVVSSYTKNWITYINTAPAPNPLARMTIWPGGGHDAWTKAYDPAYKENGMNIYEWMLQYNLSRSVGSTPVTNKPAVVNAGGDKIITLPVNSIQLTGTATDPDGTVAKYSWTVTSGPAGSSFSNAAIASPVVSKLVAGSYIFRLTATDDDGLSSSDEVKITVQPVLTDPASGVKYIKVKVYGGSAPYTNTEWNNWNVGTGIRNNISSDALKYSDASTSAVKVTMSYSGGIGDNGTTYAGGMAPKEVLRHTSYSTTTRKISLTGLSTSKKYDVEFYASRSTNPGNSSKFATGSLSKTVVTQNNLTNKVTFSGLTPDASGQIVITLDRTATYTYLNGFMITEGSKVSTPAVSKMAVAAEVTAIEAAPATTQDRTALKLNNDRTGKFNITVTDLEGNIVKELVVNKTQAGVSQSYISLKGLAKGQYVIIATQTDYSEATIVNKF
ncbi:MAG: hypothetical protein ABWZ25_01650 [Chitinophagaceae bacterium]